VGLACLPLTKPREGVYIRKSEIAETSTLRAGPVEGEVGKGKAKAVPLAIDPRGDDDKGSGVRNDKTLLNRS